MNQNDNLIAEIRQIRHSISEEFGHNPKLYIAHLREMHTRYLEQTCLYEELSNKKLKATPYRASS